MLMSRFATEPASEVAVMRVGIRCSNILERGKRCGQTCNHLLARLDEEQMEHLMAAAVEIKCQNDDCGAVTVFP